MSDSSSTDRARVALLRGAALNPFEMQAYEPLLTEFDLMAVGRRHAPYETGLIQIPTRLLHSISEYSRIQAAWRRARIPNIGGHDPDYLLGLRHLIRGFDILHSAETATPLSQQAASLLELGRSRLVLTCWETIPFRFDDNPKLSRRKELVRNATSLFIAVTDRARAALLAEGVAANRITVIPAAVDCNRFNPAVHSGELRQRWNVPCSVPLVVYIGRLIQEKGLVELLRAFSVAHSDDGHLVFVGSGNQSRRLGAAASALGLSERVHVLPAVSYQDVPSVYAAADIVVAPSLPTPYWEEQFGMVLVEAMASGRALVSSASGAIPEVVGDGALLVPPYDIDALAAALKCLLEDPQERESLGHRARERATRNFAIPQVASQLAASYRSVLAD